MNSYVVEYFLPDNTIQSVVIEDCASVPEALEKFRVRYGDEATQRIVTIHVAVL